MEFSRNTRDLWLKEIQGTTVDVIIIGGGINGAGVARETAFKGYSTVLFEKNDFGSGTSSKSSGMLHGGLRYLQYGKLRLVYEALRERNYLLNISNDLAKPEKFIYPVFGGIFKWIKIRLGIILYDILAGKNKLYSHSILNKSETLAQLPDLNSTQLKGSVIYGDALVNDVNLVLANIKSACNAGSKAMSYTCVESISQNDGLWVITFKDLLNNIHGIIKSKILVISAGPWTDKLLQSNPLLKKQNLIRPTKGIHITLPPDRIKSEYSIVIPSIDNRILFLNYSDDYLYIGTTDTDYKDDPDKVRANRDDINYILEQVNTIFPELKIENSEVLSTWAGIRPLINHPGKTGEVSREEKIINEKSGLIILTGGKLTTYRNISNKILKLIDQYFSNISFNTHTENIKLPKITPNGELPIKDKILYHLKNTMAINLNDLIFRRERFIRKNQAVVDQTANLALESLKETFKSDKKTLNKIRDDFENSKKYYEV